jgi:hypothetical protein
MTGMDAGRDLCPSPVRGFPGQDARYFGPGFIGQFVERAGFSKYWKSYH